MRIVTYDDFGQVGSGGSRCWKRNSRKITYSMHTIVWGARCPIPNPITSHTYVEHQKCHRWLRRCVSIHTFVNWKETKEKYRNRNTSRAERNLHICLPFHCEQHDFSYWCEIDAEPYIYIKDILSNERKWLFFFWSIYSYCTMPSSTIEM